MSKQSNVVHVNFKKPKTKDAVLDEKKPVAYDKPMAEKNPPTPISFDQNFVQGAQRDWPDSDLNPPNPMPRPGYSPPPNPMPGPPPPQQSYMPPPGVMPPIDQFQSAPPIPPPMPMPPRRYINPRQMPSWNPTYGMGTVPVIADSGPVSPVLALLAGGILGYAFGGWKGSLGSALVIVGANNLGLAGERTAMRLGVAAVGLGLGGYLVHSAVKKTSVLPNPPSWLRRVSG